MSDSGKEKIGFVGVGLMGHGMAKNLLANNFKVTIIGHRNRQPIENLVALGASEAKSLKELAGYSDIVHICAPGSPEVEHVVSQLKQGLKPGSIVVDCSTADPTSSLKLAADLEEIDVSFADAPLGGTPVQAEEGKLSAMVGASDETFARLQPVIDAWAATIVHIGGVGDGHKMKLLNNFLSLGYAALYSEALAIGNKAGISPQQFDSVIRGSRMDCGFYQTFMGYMIEGNREAHKFTLKNALKDLRYLESMADDAGVANPISNAAKNAFAMACANGGDGPEDYVPHLVEYIGRFNGTELKPKK